MHDHWQTISSVSLIPSAGGVYEISVGGKLIWSKKESDDFPDPEAIEKWMSAGA